jgi:hypothetical protein
MLAAARLEPLPPAVELCDSDNCCDQSQSAVEVAMPGNEVGRRPDIELHEEAGAVKATIEPLDCVEVRGGAIVCE